MTTTYALVDLFAGCGGMTLGFEQTGRFRSVFAVEWDQAEIRWYVDDHLYATHKPSDLPSGARWVFDHDFFIALTMDFVATARSRV